MSEVLCWYCENFVFFSDNPDEKNCIGVCTYKKIICDAQSRVCEDFIMRSGLHTKNPYRVIAAIITITQMTWMIKNFYRCFFTEDEGVKDFSRLSCVIF